MTLILKRLLAILLLAGIWGVATYAQTGPKIIPRDRTSPSVREGLSGEKSAGVKTNIDPQIGQTPVINYSPFRSFPAIGSLVDPFSVSAPTPSDPSTVGFKYTNSQLFFPLFSRTGRADRLYAGTKGIGGKNVTDVAMLGQPGGKNPGDPYWVAYPGPRPGNVEIPPPFQL